MTLYIIVGIVVIAVIAGIIIALKGFSWEESSAVPISDINELRSLKKDSEFVSLESKFTISPVEPVAPKPNLTDHLLKENIQTKLFQSSKPAEAVSQTSVPASTKELEEIVNLRKEIADLKEAMASEIRDSQEKIARLIKEKEEALTALEAERKNKSSQSDLADENSKLLEKLKDAEKLQQTILSLTQENDTLAKQIQSDKLKIIDFDEKMRLLNARIENFEKENAQRLQELSKKDQDFQQFRDELAVKGKQTIEAQTQLNELKQKLEESLNINRTLQEKLETINNSREIQSSQNEYAFEQLAQEKEKLIFQLKVSELKVEELQKTVEVLRQNFELRDRIIHEQKQNQVQIFDVAVLSDANQQKLEWAMLNLEELKKEKEKLNQANAELELRLSKIREHNAQLMKKESMLHYELSKSRAQAIGLEKICMNLKEQLDQAAKSTGIY